MTWSRPVLAIGVAILLALALLRVADPAPVQAVRNEYFDQLQRLSPRPHDPTLPVRVVDIDEESLARLGQWPWPRDRLARLVTVLGDLGAAVIVFDVLFAEPDRMSPARLAADPDLAAGIGPAGAALLAGLPDTDLMFAEAMRGRGVVLGVAEQRMADAPAPPQRAGLVQVGLDPALGLPRVAGLTGLVPALAEAAEGIGSINTTRSQQAGVVRSLPLMWRSETGVIPGLAVEALRVALGETTFVLMGSTAHAGLVEALRLGPFDIPATPSGELLIRFRPDHPDLYIPAHRLLEGPPDAALGAEVEGAIVLVGTSAAGLLDIRTTALGENVPGVSIHAQAIEQILLGTFLRRSEFIDGLELLGFLLVGGLVVAVMSRFGPIPSVVAGGAAAALFLGASGVAFRSEGVLLDATFPIAGGGLVFAGLTAFQHFIADRDKRRIRKSFAHYVAPSVLDQIERGGHRLRLGGEIQTVTVMFADIRNFTTLAESMPAQDLVALLNDLFSELGQEILAEKGTIDKFIGDSIMAFWNAPVPVGNHRLRACHAALRMRAALARINRRHGRSGDAALALAIGAGSGAACVGNFGSRERFNYSVLGDVVNVAARMEAMCRHVQYDILVPETVAGGAEGLALLDAGLLALRGKAAPVRGHVVVGDADLARGEGFRTLAARHAALTERLAAGQADVDGEIAACRALAAGVEPGLAAFYDRLPRRRADFPPRTAVVDPSEPV